MAEKKPNMLIGLDGIKREPKAEENLNTLFYALFNTPGGSEVLKHLKAFRGSALFSGFNPKKSKQRFITKHSKGETKWLKNKHPLLKK